MTKQMKLEYPFFVIVGPSGSGKTKVAEIIFPQHTKVISHTTRTIREMEKNGVDYYFVTKRKFEQLIEQDEFVEYDQYNKNFYGVTVTELKQRTSHSPAYGVLTYNGFQRIRASLGEEVIPIFFDVSIENVRLRLIERGEELPKIQERVALYKIDMQKKAKIAQFDNAIIIDANQSVEDVVKDVKAAINHTLSI